MLFRTVQQAAKLIHTGGIKRRPCKRMQAPTARELSTHPTVQQALEAAWADSLPADSFNRHEEGGWIYFNTTLDTITIRRAPSGAQAMLDLGTPPLVPESFVVATFHTHPNPSAEGWEPGPSIADTQSVWDFGVPCLIQTDNGVYLTGPDSRRGGLTGPPRYPQ